MTLLEETLFLLSELPYDSETGLVVLYLKGIQASPRKTQKDIDDFGRPEGKLTATLELNGSLVPELSDTIKFVVVEREDISPLNDDETIRKSFLNNLMRTSVRTALASKAIYSLTAEAGLPDYGLEILSPQDMLELGFNSSLIADLNLDPGNDGFAVGIYKDYIAGENRYILTFRGTDNRTDWGDNILQGVSIDSSQYTKAMRIANALENTQQMTGRWIVACHSLGGGLASAAAVVVNVEGYTFNAAGLQRDTIVDSDFSEAVVNYDNADSFIKAYRVDGDFLSWFQFILPGAEEGIGSVIQLDGPYDVSFIIDVFTLGWGGLPDAFNNSIKAHGAFTYGLLVDEDSSGNRQIDAYGCPDDGPTE